MVSFWKYLSLDPDFIAESDPIPLYSLYCFPSNTIVSPGDSSVPANKDPAIITLAPQARALVISPEYFIPPSAIIGISYSLAAFTQSIIAEICGTPTPVTTLVVQIDPGPIPTFTASTPASIKSFVASPVATFPAINWRFGYFSFIFLIAVITPFEWPWAVSTVTTSTFAFSKASILSIMSWVIPTAAPTNNLSCSSLAEFGYCLDFSISLIVIRPFNLKSSSTIGSFSTFPDSIFLTASSIEIPTWPTIRPSFVMISSIFTFSSFWNLTSLFVKIPFKVIWSSTIGTPLIL